LGHSGGHRHCLAVGVLALLGGRVPSSLKIFLLALAILDDLGSIVIIAVFYTSDLRWSALLAAASVAGVLAILNRAGVTRLAPYLLIGLSIWGLSIWGLSIWGLSIWGLSIWLCVLKSGVPATLAGVVVAAAIPLAKGRPQGTSLLERLEE
jgi:Na+:H+ antiporter, NhaA family